MRKNDNGGKINYEEQAVSYTHLAGKAVGEEKPLSGSRNGGGENEPPGNDVRPDGADLRSPSCEEGLLVREAQKQK